MGLNPEEVSSVIKKELEKYETKLEMESVGTVLQVGDGIARIWGLEDVQMSELVEFPGDILGLVLNLEEDNVGVALFGPDTHIHEGDTVRRTGKVAQVPVGDALVGRVVNPLGQPLDGKGPIVTDKFRIIEGKAPNVVERQPVKEPLQTGLKAIDSMIPIGRGQRELIIGDRQTGKTAVAPRCDYQSEKYRCVLYLRRYWPEGLDRGSGGGNTASARRYGIYDGCNGLRDRPGAVAVYRAVCRMRHG